MSSQSRLAVFAAVCGTLPSAPTHSQDVLLDLKPPVSGSSACYAAGIGDVDGDGIDDIAVGALLDDTNAVDAGALRFHSGKDGSVLATLYGTTAAEHFGAPVARVPDLDGDGVDEVAIGAPGASNSGPPGTGSVFVVSGRTAATLLQIDGPANAGGFGRTIGVLGDADGDGVSDLVIGHGDYFDTVHVHSGFDGHEITSVQGIPRDGFGLCVSVLDDLDADGVRDLVISAPYHLDSQGQMVGAVFVISTATGTVQRTHLGSVGADFGGAIASFSDHDGDGVSEYVFADFDVAAGERVYRVCSGVTGVEIAKISPSADQSWSFAGMIADAGDVNGDGVGDLCIGNGSDDSLGVFHGAAYIFSGKTWLQLDRIDLGGWAIPVTFVDFDRNGCIDLLIGIADTPALDGKVSVYSGAQLWLNATPVEVDAGDRLALATREGVPGALTIVALEDVDGVPTFQIVDGLATFGSQGGRRIVEQVPAGLAGHDLTFRSYTHDIAGRLIHSADQVVRFR